MHDDFENRVTDYENFTEVEGLEHFHLKSVGITVGSSTSHLMFSELVVRRSDSRLSGETFHHVGG